MTATRQLFLSRNRTPLLFLLLTLLLTCSTASAAAESAGLRLPNIFGDGMVLQCEKPVGVWGFAKPGEEVTVSFAGQTKTATADDNGDWAVKLDPMKPSFDGRTLSVKAGSGSVEIKDVLVGEVWICGGQSNMEFKLRSTRDADLEVACADYPAIRYIRLPHVARPEPQKDFPVESPETAEGNWRDCTSETAGDCTGVGYYFVRLYRRLDVPVGLVDISWGGTMAQHWCSKETLQTIPAMKSYIDDFEANLKKWNDGGGEEGAKKRYEADVKKWEDDVKKAQAAGERVPRKPNPNAYTTPADKRQPAGMYNGMILPISGMTIRGAVFYQGENNSFGETWKPFIKTFPAVIADWRKAFGDDELPMGLIQIAGWSNRRSMHYDMNHHTNVVREIQFLTWQRTKNTGLIVSYDANSNGSIHPAHKQPVGQRTARWALAEVYDARQSGSDRPLEWKGPVYKSFEISDGKVTISFEEGTARGLRLDKDDDGGFYIAGKDREFHHARATVDGEKVVVYSDAVPEPMAVRYGVSNLPFGHLMNGRELPAYPFRTDRWPLVPHYSDAVYQVE